MNKEQIIKVIRDEMFITEKQAERFVNVFTKTVMSAVYLGDDVMLQGFGTFTRGTRKSRPGRNPRTMQEMIVPEMVFPKFRPHPKFKNLIKGEK